jgi:hypothetical protein
MRAERTKGRVQGVVVKAWSQEGCSTVRVIKEWMMRRKLSGDVWLGEGTVEGMVKRQGHWCVLIRGKCFHAHCLVHDVRV